MRSLVVVALLAGTGCRSYTTERSTVVTARGDGTGYVYVTRRVDEVTMHQAMVPGVGIGNPEIDHVDPIAQEVIRVDLRDGSCTRIHGRVALPAVRIRELVLDDEAHPEWTEGYAIGDVVFVQTADAWHVGRGGPSGAYDVQPIPERLRAVTELADVEPIAVWNDRAVMLSRQSEALLVVEVDSDANRWVSYAACVKQR